MDKTLKLYGMDVPAADYERVKHIADLLLGYSSAGTPLRMARRIRVRLALMAITEAKLV